jgi:hypothetical protein
MRWRRNVDVSFLRREGGRRRRDTFHVFMSAVKMARLVNLISHYVVDISYLDKNV